MPVLRHVTIKRFCELSGYTPDAVNGKIKRGEWLHGAVWIKAPDGRRLIDLEGFEQWASGECAQHQRAVSRSTSTGTGSAAANG